MNGFLAEILRIAATPVGAVVGGATGPAGALTGPLAAGALNALANQIDREDDPATPEGVRKMKQRRREDWIKFALGLEKDKAKKLDKYPAPAREAIKKVLDESDAASLRAVIRGEILETEGRIAGDQEVNILAEAVAARVKEKL
jgi:hypothetical protein